jgi:glycosyltransferase involved in cell wall biosynthesis
MPGDLAVVIPAKNEADRISATVRGAASLPGVDWIVVVDDGSTDGTAAVAEAAGARVVRHARNRGKAVALETGAEAIRLLESGPGTVRQAGSGTAHHLLFLDADLGETAAAAGPLAEPIRRGTADMTMAVFSNRVRRGGFGFVTAASGAGIERATGWRPAQPLNGQRCLTRAAFEAALPLAHGWGIETGMTIDLIRRGMRITEVEVPLAHRATGQDWRSQLHRARQLVGVGRALAAREPATRRARRERARA